MASTPEIWVLLFEQTPPMLRWVLGILTLGLFTLATWLWRRQQERVAAIDGRMFAVERREREYITRDEFNHQMAYLGGRIDSGFAHLDERMDRGFTSVQRRIDEQIKGQAQ